MNRVGTWQACVVVALGSLASSISFAQSEQDCTTIVDNLARLTCYDQQAIRQRGKMPPAAATRSAAPAAAPAPAAATTSTAPAAAPPASTSEQFGLDPEVARKKRASDNPDAPKQADEVQMLVKEVKTKPRGDFRITMDDGQVWEETQHTGGLAPAAGETVTIKKGLLGGYFLNRKSGLALRVKRIQ